MRVTLECIPCYITQTINTLVQTELSQEKKREIILQIMTLIPDLDPQGTPAGNSTILLRKVNQLLGTDDPFRKAKQESNDLALKLLPGLQETIEKSRDPLFTALKISVAGNIIDLGIIRDIDVEGSIRDAMETEFARDDYEDFRAKLKEAREVLILGDNCGEIAFDRLLAEQLTAQGLRVTHAVKDQPILNDATLEDAVYVGMTEKAWVISNGSGFLGTIMADCSEEFRQAFAKADLVISKGQANYESLETLGLEDRRLYFLLRAKCEIVAQSLGVRLGRTVFCRT